MKNKISTIVTYAICGIAVVLVAFTAWTMLRNPDTAQEKENKGFLGYHCFVVLSGSMTAQFGIGDVVIIKQVDTEDIRQGNIISFQSIDPAYDGEIVTHKIRSITEYEGQIAYETYGTTTGVSDAYPALADKVIGKYQTSIPAIGHAVLFIQGKFGFFWLVMVPLFIILVVQVIKLIYRIRHIEDEEEQETPLMQK